MYDGCFNYLFWGGGTFRLPIFLIQLEKWYAYNVALMFIEQLGHFEPTRFLYFPKLVG